MSTAHLPSSLFEEIATFFASAPTPQEIVEFRPSQGSKERASQLLELNRAYLLDKHTQEELNQYEQAELLMRLIKARVHAKRADDTRPR